VAHGQCAIMHPTKMVIMWRTVVHASQKLGFSGAFCRDAPQKYVRHRTVYMCATGCDRY
jgi:hypothetical protein